MADPYADVTTFAEPWMATFGSEEEQNKFKALSDDLSSTDKKDTAALLQKKEALKKFIAETSKRFNPALPKTSTEPKLSIWD